MTAQNTPTNRCAVCNQIIDGEVVFAAQRFWCRYHFTCCRCNATLRGDKYNVFDEKHYCPDCFNFMRPKCVKCNKGLEIREEYIKFGHHVTHKQCFTCNDCNQVLNPMAFALENDLLLCEQCCIKRHTSPQPK